MPFFLHQLHNNYRNVKICLHVAQITRKCRKLNILHENYFTYWIHGEQSKKSRFQIRIKLKHSEAGSLFKNNNVQLQVNFPSSYKKRV